MSAQTKEQTTGTSPNTEDTAGQDKLPDEDAAPKEASKESFIKRLLHKARNEDSVLRFLVLVLVTGDFIFNRIQDALVAATNWSIQMIQQTDSLAILLGGLVAYALLYFMTTHSGPVSKHWIRLWGVLMVSVEAAGCMGAFLWGEIHPITVGTMALLGAVGLLVGFIGWERLEDKECPSFITVWEKLYADKKKMFAFWVKIALLIGAINAIGWPIFIASLR